MFDDYGGKPTRTPQGAEPQYLTKDNVSGPIVKPSDVLSKGGFVGAGDVEQKYHKHAQASGVSEDAAHAIAADWYAREEGTVKERLIGRLAEKIRAALAAERNRQFDEKLPCGHPIACWISDTKHTPSNDCLICAEVADALAAQRQESEKKLAAAKEYKPALCGVIGHMQIDEMLLPGNVKVCRLCYYQGLLAAAESKIQKLSEELNNAKEGQKSPR